MEEKKRQSLTKPVGKGLTILAVAMTVTTGAISLYSLAKFRTMSQSSASVSHRKPTISAVGALGRIEPQGEVFHLSAPNALQGARVAKLLVKKGDKVRAGQVVAMLDSNVLRLAALEQAQAQVQVYKARLAQVRAGAKTGDIAAQKATIARLNAELSNSQLDYQRYQSLYAQGAISASLRDNKQLAMETAQEQLSQAKASLNSVAEVRPTDLQAAQAEVDNAKAAVKQAKAELELTYMRAPINGQILKIHTWPGEIVGNEGIADLGQTNQMYVVAEVYETDVEKVRLGQRANVTSESFSGKLGGTVTEIGLQVTKQNIFNVNPTADTDRKVVEVKIRLDDPADNLRVAALTDLQVQVLIHV